MTANDEGTAASALPKADSERHAERRRSRERGKADDECHAERQGVRRRLVPEVSIGCEPVPEQANNRMRTEGSRSKWRPSVRHKSRHIRKRLTERTDVRTAERLSSPARQKPGNAKKSPHPAKLYNPSPKDFRKLLIANCIAKLYSRGHEVFSEILHYTLYILH